jgi:hypothetical protein
MRSKLVISTFVVAAFLGGTAIASAQTQPTAGASAEGGTGSKMAPHRMKSRHTMRYSRARMDKSRPGGRPVSQKIPS